MRLWSFAVSDWFGVFTSNWSWSSSNCNHFSAPTPSCFLPLESKLLPVSVQIPEFFCCFSSFQLFPPAKSHSTFQPQTQNLKNANFNCPSHVYYKSSRLFSCQSHEFSCTSHNSICSYIFISVCIYHPRCTVSSLWARTCLFCSPLWYRVSSRKPDTE